MSDAFAHLDPVEALTATWKVQRVGLPRLRRRCPDCTTNVAAATGKFRVNANGRLLDVWLLIRCAHCGRNARIKVHHRTNVANFAPETLRGYQNNDPELITAALLDPLNARHGHYTLDWTDAWKLTTSSAEPSTALGPGPSRRMLVHVQFDIPAPIRPVRIIAQGLTRSRGDIERLINARRITSDLQLKRKTSQSFDFTITPG